MKQIYTYIGIIVFFIVTNYIYFSPQLSGKQLKTHDINQFRGGAKEIIDYKKKQDYIKWTNSMFCGMPTYPISLHSISNSFVYFNIVNVFFNRPISYVLTGMICFLILSIVLKINPYVGAVASIAYGFSTYEFVIMASGHFTKALSLAYLPGLLAGILLVFKGRLLYGATLIAFIFGLELMAFHPQMTYYFCVFFLVPYGIFKLIESLKSKEIKKFLIRSGIVIGALVIGYLPSTTKILMNKEYIPFSTRGKSELSVNKENKSDGLDKSYILAWSSGVSETFSFMIPKTKGGASGTIDSEKKAIQKVSPQLRPVMKSVDKYWGDQPFIAGPNYSGAIVIFLFILALFLLNNKFKWIGLISVLLTIMLSWGKNFMPLSDFFIDYFPLYNKFRAVVSIQTVTHFVFVFLLMLILDEIVKNKININNPLIILGKPTKYKKMHAFYASFLLSGGLCFLFALMPNVFFDFFKQGEIVKLSSQLQNVGWERNQITNLINNISIARSTIFTSSSFQSAFLITLAFICVILFIRKKIKLNIFIFTLGILVLVDFWIVNKEYLNENNFAPKGQVKRPFLESKADRYILQDEDKNYRVLNLSLSTFNDASTSYFHKSIGGYSAAKMKKYQEIVEQHIHPEIQIISNAMKSASSLDDFNQFFSKLNILNALNTKYIIYNKDATPIVNTNIYGDAWFVENIKYVQSADEEINEIKLNKLNKTAVIQDKYKELITADVISSDGKITLTSYHPERMVYQSENNYDGIAIFSEIYYPLGWKVTIDGKQVDYFSADYILRGLQISKGKHEIIFTFSPDSYSKMEKASLIGYILIIVLLLLSLGTVFKNYFINKKQNVE